MASSSNSFSSALCHALERLGVPNLTLKEQQKSIEADQGNSVSTPTSPLVSFGLFERPLLLKRAREALAMAWKASKLFKASLFSYCSPSKWTVHIASLVNVYYCYYYYFFFIYLFIYSCGEGS